MSYKTKEIISSQTKRGSYSDELKQRLVVATNQPGASLTRIAEAQGVSISALSKWRRQYQQQAAPATLIPIAIQQTKTSSCMAPADVEAIAEGLPPGEQASRPLGMIEIILQRARVQIRGMVDSDTLRVVLKSCQDD